MERGKVQMEMEGLGWRVSEGANVEVASGVGEEVEGQEEGGEVRLKA